MLKSATTSGMDEICDKHPLLPLANGLTRIKLESLPQAVIAEQLQCPGFGAPAERPLGVCEHEQ